MLRHKRTKFRLLPDSFNKSGSTAHAQEAQQRIEEASEISPVARKIPQPTLSQMIEQRTWENEQLRKELIYQQMKHGLSVYLLEEVRLVVDSLQKALQNFQQRDTEIENECVARGN